MNSEFHRTYGSYAINSHLVKGGVEVRSTLTDDLKKYIGFLEAKDITYRLLNNFSKLERTVQNQEGTPAVHKMPAVLS